MSALVFLPILLILFYLLLIRPQQQRARAQQRLFSSLGVGDRIVTIGGIIGTIVELRSDRVVLEMVDGARIELLRQAVSRKLEDAPGMDVTDDDLAEDDWSDHDDEDDAEAGVDTVTEEMEADDPSAAGDALPSTNGHAPLDAGAAAPSEEDQGNR